MAVREVSNSGLIWTLVAVVALVLNAELLVLTFPWTTSDRTGEPHTFPPTYSAAHGMGSGTDATPERNGNVTYSISMYHALNCLATIRDEMYHGNVAQVDGSDDSTSNCFEYIRQSIMCAADLTLEEGDGWGQMHMCKDQNEVMSFVGEWNPYLREQHR
ncbi:hypothetical protein M409DRAFT_54169 [Zasmidium cellare ATCC 36951]|uniref:Uncharacterized protein n=1 Tax=Zasmidium cellare ATCC 36951 TaxID=1080233 RepID=A0A6A6CK15_ZASCE|nr:uncharacterized protein M409DRAFT_54169 [Zasmidium cellare ATCC 36951]KAF2167577.1 hypothetical protein M409DRAFT_54169 [Zasmidium cellare ATCC 36951]